MAVVLGTNAGFVTTAPTADPGGSTKLSINDQSRAVKDTSPSESIKVTEIGWWCDTATQEADFEVGIYEHNGGDNEPEALVGKSTATAKGTSSGWKVVTGLNILINPSTIYWIAVQLDNTATTTNIDRGTGGGGLRIAIKTSQTTLSDPWGSSDTFNDFITISAYALVEGEPPTGVTIQGISSITGVTSITI